MADIYQHQLVKFSDAGLNLRLPPDLIPPGQYSKLTNALPIIEGRLEARSPLDFLVNVANPTSPGSGLHSITRLNQPSTASIGDRVAGVDTTVQTYVLPAGVVPTVRDTGRTGDPLSLPVFHFNADTAAWQIIADRQAMIKYRGGSGVGYYGPLGVFQPQTPIVSAADGGAGNLNNGSGPAYDWVYTHVFLPTLSESNPSFPTTSGTNEDVTPSNFTNPDPGFGGSPTSPGPTTTTTTVMTVSSSNEGRQSVLWTPWSAATLQPYSQLYLDIAGSFVVTGTSGCVYGAIYFSTDGGLTWNLYVDCSKGTVSFGIPRSNSFGLILLNPNQDLSKLQVRAIVLSTGNVIASQNVIARRIRDRAGNFNINDLLVGANATNAQITLTITTIHTHAVQLGVISGGLALANRLAKICIIDPRTLVPQPMCDAINLYRRGGSVTASWAFVSQSRLTSLSQGICGANTLEIDDNVADANLGGFVNLTNDAPVTSVYVLQRPLPYIWGPGFNPSRMFGCGDPDRPDAVYFSNAGNADQWAASNWMDASYPTDPMQNGCTFNTRVFAFSKERMYEIVPAVVGGGVFQPFETECRRGLISPYGLLSTARAIYFVAKDGIYATTGGPEQSLVENDIKPLFPTYDAPQGRQVEGYDLINFERIEDIRLRFHNDEIYFIYRGLNSGNLQMLVYDQNKQRWRAVSYPVQITTIYSEEAGPASSLLLGDSSGSMYTTEINNPDELQSSTVPIPVTIQTGAYDQGMPLNLKEYGNVLFDIDPGGATLALPVTITPLLNGEMLTQPSLIITGSGRQQVPLSLSDVFGYNIEFLITFSRNATINPILYQFDILWRPEPVSVTHWEARDNSYGMPGYWHIRDMYVALRSNSIVNLTITIDGGTPIVLPIQSTGGKRQKVYLPFPANKGKLYKFSLDSADGVSQFRIYTEDFEMRAKPWLTNLGYASIKALGVETSLVSQAFEGRMLSGG